MAIADYDENLKDFCKSNFSPSNQLAAKRTYQVGKVQDMADLSVRFMGIGNDRLVETLKRSRGLTLCKRGEVVSRVPPHNFPQGKWARGKIPKVSKEKVKYLHKASIAVVVFTDTFQTDDRTFKYSSFGPSSSVKIPVPAVMIASQDAIERGKSKEDEIKGFKRQASHTTCRKRSYFQTPGKGSMVLRDCACTLCKWGGSHP